ncbi:MAG: hypothetical protein JSV13_01460 [Nitrospiraceae bacterium]|nr:MAG: hypothetical protein JSV13_01460 [Nitrospiraceae bacterium]
MACNEEIAGRIKKIVASWKNTDSKKMFGGVCYLLRGNVFCGVYKDFLILRRGKRAQRKHWGLSMSGLLILPAGP